MPLISESSVDSVVCIWLVPGFAHCPVASSLLTEGSTTILAASRDSWLSTPPPVCLNLELKKVPFFAVLLENYGRKKSDFLCNTPSLGGTEGLR